MTARSRTGDRRTANPAAGPQRWLLFVHQLPASPSNLRVRTWRRMQQLGAIVVKQSVYVLPDSAAAREDFEWLKSEIEAAGGQASVFSADTVDAWLNDAIVEEFRRSREEAYTTLARDGDKLLKRLAGRSRKPVPPRVVQQLRQRLTAIERIDFFGSGGRDRAAALVRQIEERASPRRRAATSTAVATPGPYKARTWLTRPRPGVDRMSSAWLIRRFIDADARFAFAADPAAGPPDAIPFDMFGVEFTHRGDLCTFEMLRETFSLKDPALGSIGALVHDVDLKDARFGAPEAPAIALVIEGLRLAHADDHELLRHGMTLFEALYLSFTQANRSTQRRPPAGRRTRGHRPSRARSV